MLPSLMFMFQRGTLDPYRKTLTVKLAYFTFQKIDITKGQRRHKFSKRNTLGKARKVSFPFCIRDNLIFSYFWFLVTFNCSLSGGSDSKESAWNAGDLGSIPGLGRSPAEGNGNSLQCSCLKNPMDRGAWQATAHGVAESDTTEWLTLSLSTLR